MSYVLYIKFANDPPRVAVFDALDDAEGVLDAFEVSMFDPPVDNPPSHDLLRARIFECRAGGWGAEIDIEALRRRMQAETESCFE